MISIYEHAYVPAPVDAEPIRVQNETAQHPCRNRMSTVQVKLSKRVVDRALAFKPDYDSNTAHLSRLIESAIDASFTLDERPSRPQAGLPTEGVSPFNSSFKRRDKDVEISLQAEEAHIPTKALKKIKPAFDLPGCLFPHEDLIRSYWKAKPKTKTQAAWDLLMRELTKIQDNYGDDVVRDQLVLAEAQRFQSITLKNYEQFGVRSANTPTQASGLDYAAMDAIRTPW